jgi:hypothetical protein
MTIRRVLDRLLVVRNDQGLAASIQVHEFDGDRYLRTLPPADILLDDPEFSAIAGELGADALAQRDAIAAELEAAAKTIKQRDGDLSVEAAKQAQADERIAALEAEIKADRIQAAEQIASWSAINSKHEGELEIVRADLDRVTAKLRAAQAEIDAAAVRLRDAEIAAQADAAEIARLGAGVDLVGAAVANNPRLVYPFEFLERFTAEQRLAILTAAQSDARVGLILAQVQTVQRVDLDAPATAEALDYLVAIGAIAPDDVARILA